MKMILRAASATFLLFAAVTTALAVSTTTTQVTSTTWTDLGAGPLVVQTLGDTAQVAVSDASPAVSDRAFILYSAVSNVPTNINSTAHIWAKALNNATTVVSAPISTGASAAAGTQEQDVTESRTLNAASTSSQQTYTLNGQSTFSFNFTGLAASGATVSFYQSNDWNGTTGTFTGISEVNTGTGVPSLTRSTDGQSAIGIEGTKAIRVQVTTAGTGTITLATNISVRSRYQALRAPLPPGPNAIGSVFPMPGTTWTQAADKSCTASTVCSLLSTTSRKYLTITNTTATGYCRIAYGGVTPSATLGDPLGPAAVASGQGGGRTFESSYVPSGTVNAFCTVNSTLAVSEGN